MTACPSCGAAVRDGDARCPLCGTDVAATPALDASVLDAPDRPAFSGGLVCPSCGHANPSGARFCNECGTTLAAEAPAAEAPAAEARTPVRPVAAPAADSASAPAAPADAAGRRALLFVGGGVAIVVALFAINALSARAPATPTAAPAGPQAAAGGPAAAAAAVPDGPTPALPDSLQRQADALEGQNTAEGWYEGGRFYLTAGFDAQQTGDTNGVLWIRRAVADFEKSLALEDDADVRFALAEASQFDPANPMRPVVELRTLLAEHPDHIGGNFLLGERRMMIGRLDSARVSFQRVAALAPASDPLRARALQMIAQLDEAGAPTRGVPDGAGAPPPAGVPSGVPPVLPPAQ